MSGATTNEVVVIGLAVLAVAGLICQIILIRKPAPNPPDLSETNARVEAAQRSIQQAETGMRDEFSRLRQEFAGQHQAFRLEVASSLVSHRSPVCGMQRLRNAEQPHEDLIEAYATKDPTRAFWCPSPLMVRMHTISSEANPSK